MSGEPRHKAREAIFRDLVELHHSIAGRQPDVVEPVVESETQADVAGVMAPEHLFVEHCPMGILMARIVRDRYRHPVSYQISSVNRRYAELIGLSRVSVLESDFFAVLPGGVADWKEKLEAVCLKGRSAQGVSQALRVDRLLRVVVFRPDRNTLAIMLDEASGGASGGLNRSASRHLRQARELLQSAQLLICRFLPGGKLVYANRAYQEYFGNGSQSLAGPAYLEMIPAEERDYVRSRVELICRDCPYVSYVGAFDLPDRRCWVQWAIEGVFDETGTLSAYQSVGIDVSETASSRQHAKRLNGLLRDLLSLHTRRSRDHVTQYVNTDQNRQMLIDQNRALTQRVEVLEKQTLIGDFSVCRRCSRINHADGSWMLPSVFLAFRTQASVAEAICPYCLNKSDDGGATAEGDR